MRQSASLRKNKASLPPLNASGLRTYLRLLAYARPHWRKFLLGVVGMILYAAVDTGFAVLVKKFVDGAFEVRDQRMLVYMPAGIIGLFLVRGVGDYLSVYAPGWVGRQVIKSIRRDVFARYLQLPVVFLRPERRRAAPLATDLQRRAGGRGRDECDHHHTSATR